MPTYDYCCKACGKHTEAFQKISEPALVQCPHCKQEALQRGPGGGAGLAFKGSGFYITDYAKKQSCCPCGKEKDSCKS